MPNDFMGQQCHAGGCLTDDERGGSSWRLLHPGRLLGTCDGLGATGGVSVGSTKARDDVLFHVRVELVATLSDGSGHLCRLTHGCGLLLTHGGGCSVLVAVVVVGEAVEEVSSSFLLLGSMSTDRCSLLRYIGMTVQER